MVARYRCGSELAIWEATTPDLVDIAGKTIGKAFAEDAVLNYLVRQDEQRLAAIDALCLANTRWAARVGRVHLAGQGEAALLWLPADAPRQTMLSWLPLVPTAWRAAGGLGRVLRGARLAHLLEGKHPSRPHCYGWMLGVLPSARGQGLGGKLIRLFTRACDEQGLPAHIECSNPSLLPLYEKNGFHITEEVKAEGGQGPRLWLMAREPS